MATAQTRYILLVSLFRMQFKRHLKLF